MIDREQKECVNDELCDAIELLKREFAKKSDEERAYIIIKTFFRLQDGADESTGSERSYVLFHEWLCSPHSEEAKEKALERVFNEILDGITVPELPDMPGSKVTVNN